MLCAFARLLYLYASLNRIEAKDGARARLAINSPTFFNFFLTLLLLLFVFVVSAQVDWSAKSRF